MLDIVDISFSSIWCVFALCSVLVTSWDQVFDIAFHGKLLNFRSALKKNQDSPNKWFSFRGLHFYVPKRWFCHLYVVGLLVTTLKFIYNYRVHRTLLNIDPQTSLMIISHTTRRLIESQYLTIYGDAKIHIAGYVCGLAHYTITPLTLIYSRPNLVHFSDLNLRIISLIIFISANYIQYKSHLILYQMKMKNNSSKSAVYQLPTKFLFKNISCPHYTAEVLIYISFSILCYDRLSAMFLTIWVASNLAVVSDLHYCYYIKHYSNSIPSHYCRMIPGVW